MAIVEFEGWITACTLTCNEVVSFAKHVYIFALIVWQIKPIKALNASFITVISNTVLNLVFFIDFWNLAFFLQQSVSTVTTFTFILVWVEISTLRVNLCALICWCEEISWWTFCTFTGWSKFWTSCTYIAFNAFTIWKFKSNVTAETITINVAVSSAILTYCFTLSNWIQKCSWSASYTNSINQFST